MKKFFIALISLFSLESLCADKFEEVDFSLTASGIDVSSVEATKKYSFSCKVRIMPNGHKVKTKSKNAFRVELVRSDGELIGNFFFDYDLPSGAERIGDEFHYKDKGNSLINLTYTVDLRLLRQGDYTVRIVSINYFVKGAWREFKPDILKKDKFSSPMVGLP